MLCLLLVSCYSLPVFSWFFFFFFKQKTAYEMRISDWSSDVCSSDLELDGAHHVRSGSVIRLQIVNCRIEIEFALDRVGRDRVSDLAGSVLVFFGHVGEHPAEQRDIDGFTTIESRFNACLNCFGCGACGGFFFLAFWLPGIALQIGNAS